MMVNKKTTIHTLLQIIYLCMYKIILLAIKVYETTKYLMILCFLIPSCLIHMIIVATIMIPTHIFNLSLQKAC